MIPSLFNIFFSMLFFTNAQAAAGAGKAEAIGSVKAPSQAPEIEEVSNTTKPEFEFMYDPNSGRDPFKTPKGINLEAREPKKTVLSNDPLQRINLDKVQILGIIWSPTDARAMVRDGDSQGIFTITKKTKLGPNQGIVTDINERSIVVLETVTNDDGDEVKVPRTLLIRGK